MASVVISGDTSGAVTITAPAVAGTPTLTLPTTTGTLATLTTPSFTTTIGVGGATASASGSGISFPATQSSSSDANTLDDYEEGTWTPIIKGTSTNPSYTTSAASGSYVKIGRMVYVSFIIIVTAVSSQGTGNIYMDTLPFTVNDQSYAPTLTVMYNDTWDVDFRAMYANGISWTMRPIGITQSNATWGGSSALSTGYFSGSGCYLTT